MFKRFRILALTFLFMMILSPAVFAASTDEIAAEGYCGDHLSWSLTNGGLLTIDGYGPMENYGHYGLSADAPWNDWKNPDVKEVVLPAGLTSIGDYAFNGCGQLEAIELPYGLERIGANAFQFCYALTTVEIPNTVTEIGANVFRQCQGLTSVTLPRGLEEIPDAAFMNSGIVSIDIPNSVTTIAHEAFFECDSLKEISIPENVTEIGSRVFARCSSLESIWVDRDNQYYSSDKHDVLFDKEMTTLIQYPVGRSSAYYTIPDGVKEVGEEAFYSSENLVKVTIPDGVTRLYEMAFGACTGIGTITIPSSMQTIDSYTFHECPNLVKVTIEEGVTSLGTASFSYCPRLHTVSFPSSVTAIHSSPFHECGALRTILFMGDALTYAGEAESSHPVFPGSSTLYYFADSEGWTSPTWKGYKTAMIMGAIGRSSMTETITTSSPIISSALWITSRTAFPE